MKTLMMTLFCLFSANVALANTGAGAAAPSYDSLALMALLVVGLVCLVIARRRIV